MSKYKIVEFSDNGGVAVILSDWMTPRKSEVFWPPYRDQISFDKALKKQEPMQETWKVFPVARVFYETDNLDVAYKKAKKAEQSSNLETDEEEIPRKRKITVPLRNLYSSDEEELSQHRRPPKISFKKKAVGTPPSQEPVSTPNDSANPSTSQANFNYSQSVLLRPSGSNSKEVSKEEEEASTSKPEKDSILHSLLILKEQNKEIISILKTIQGKVFANECHNSQSFNIPFGCIGDLEALETDLDDDITIKQLTKCCTKYGGDGATNRTNRILKELLTDTVASYYSFYGKRSDKRAFSNLKLKRVVVDAVKTMCPAATDVEIENCIKVWLKHAPQRVKTKLAKGNNDV